MLVPQSFTPIIGTRLSMLLDSSGLDANERNYLQERALTILSRCSPPVWTSRSENVQLVVGAVQAGKTLAFTSVIAAARDNGFPLVIVLAGTKKLLRDQTYKRLVKDLAMGGDGRLPAWDPRKVLKSEDTAEVLRTIDSWRNSNRRATPPTIVSVILKNRHQLTATVEVMSEVGKRHPGLPVLIIDDEGDQAGLNTMASLDEESSTYRAINELRAALPNHNYIMVTATPQAPLLIEIADVLSPRQVTVIEPGKRYMGGQELFGPDQDHYLRIIDEPEALDLSDPRRPPQSLVQAFSQFCVSTVVAQLRGSPCPTSMLVHPSGWSSGHSVYDRWIRQIRSRFLEVLDSEDDRLIEYLVQHDIEPAYRDIEAFGGTIREGVRVSLDEVLQWLPSYLDNMRIRVVNSATKLDIDTDEWLQASSWILIGGNKLERGFTVENLIVTYMPRSPGVGNADTIQQRGRFFGYKHGYRDLIRIWITGGTKEAFSNYVEHEAYFMAELSEVDARDLPLSSWKRRFLLDPALRPTRSTVISMGLDVTHVEEGWHTQSRLFLPSLGPGDAIREEIRSCAELIPKFEGWPHSYLDVRWGDIVRWLVDWHCHPKDYRFLSAALLALSAQIQDDEHVGVWFMDGLRTRTRGAASFHLDRKLRTGDMRVTNLFQGPSPTGSSGYPGDRYFGSETVALQIHNVVAETGEGEQFESLAYALHIPMRLSRLITQKGV